MTIVEQIIDLAAKGVYLQELLDNLNMYSNKEVFGAIREARKKGLYSVSNMHDRLKGTYYRYKPKQI
jgi:phosphatidylserine/phosphatidylglycerophosphate/cardiolipin synthase-like enzyme